MDALALDDDFRHAVPCTQDGTPAKGQTSDGACDTLPAILAGSGAGSGHTIFAATLRRRRARARAYPGSLGLIARTNTAGVLIGAQADFLSSDPLPRLAALRSGGARGRRAALSAQQARDRDLLQAGCLAASAWPTDLRLMVTLSEQAGAQPDFAAHVLTLARASDFDVAHLDLALPEAALGREIEGLGDALATLRDRGVGIYWAAFGMAPCSLTRLRDLAGAGLLSGVQFDAGVLVQGPVRWRECGAVQEDSVQEAYFEAHLAALRILGLRSRAVGVDHEASLRFARRVGCDEMSGSAVSEPEGWAVLSGATAEQGEWAALRRRRRARADVAISQAC